MSYKNKEKQQETQRKYREKNKDRLKEIKREYYLKNRKLKGWIKLTPEQIKLNKDSYTLKRRLDNPCWYLWNIAKKRAKSKGLEFDIEISDVFIPEYCPVLGVELEMALGKATPNSPSLDRIDSGLGYVKGNVHVISNRANKLKNDATPLELKLLADYFVTLVGI